MQIFFAAGRFGTGLPVGGIPDLSRDEESIREDDMPKDKETEDEVRRRRRTIRSPS